MWRSYGIILLAVLISSTADGRSPSRRKPSPPRRTARPTPHAARYIIAESQDRLADWSYAGYQGQARPIPNPPVVADVRDHCGIGDGKADDTAAIRAAIDAAVHAGGGAVHLPAGRYLISGRIQINASNIALRGEGPGVTVIMPAGSLADVDGVTDVSNRWGAGGTTQSVYSWWGGFLAIQGPPSATVDPSGDHPGRHVYHPGEELLAKVTKAALSYSRILYVDKTDGIAAGSLVRLFMSDPAVGNSAGGQPGSLAEALYDNRLKQYCASDAGLAGTPDLVRFPSRVSSVGAGYIVLERAVPWAVQLGWGPQIRAHPAATPQDSGIENLSIHFPWALAAAHHEERGYNAIYLANAANCWVRNVVVYNADSGVMLNNADFVTVAGVTLAVEKPRSGVIAGGMDGHHGISINYGNDILVRDFRIAQRQWHDTGVHATAHVAFHRGWGQDLVMDCHRTAPWGTLWADIRLGVGRRVYGTGGSVSCGLPCASRTTYYNVSKDDSALTMPLPPFATPCGWSTRTNFIGNSWAAQPPSRQCPEYWIYDARPSDFAKLQLPQVRHTPPAAQPPVALLSPPPPLAVAGPPSSPPLQPPAASA